MFFDSENGRLCAVHRELGEPLLPSACRQFPRVTLTDPRGRWITLSHFCPTAAALLFSPTPIRIVPAPASISLGGAAEGLDATAALPPLLRPGMLMDFDGYLAWAGEAVGMLGTHGATAGQALAALGALTRVIQRWSPGEGSLCDCVERVFGTGPEVEARTDDRGDREAYALALASVPEGLPIPFTPPPDHTDPVPVQRIVHAFDDVVRRYLAAKVFGCWWPYLGLDLAGVTRAIEMHAAALRMRLSARVAQGDRDRPALLEAIRETDLLMVHLSDGRALADTLAR
ncbi:MAG: hypothetical protein ABIX28_21950 [Vicinamibacterales bacterium]